VDQATEAKNLVLFGEIERKLAKLLIKGVVAGCHSFFVYFSYFL
jgi:hypothetical protein